MNNVRKHICFFMKNYGFGGGVERVTSILANDMVDRGYDVSIVSCVNGLSPRYDTNSHVHLYEIGIMPETSVNIPLSAKIPRMIRLPLALINILLRPLLPLQTCRLQKKTKKLLKKIKPDVVISADLYFYPYLIPAQKKLGFKTIAHEHSCLSMPRGKNTQKNHQLAIEYADRVIVLTDSDLKDYREAFPGADHILRIYDPSTYEISDSIHPEHKVVMASGQCIHRKGFDMLIDAWNQIADRVPDWELRIFGEGEEKENFQNRIDRYGLKNARMCGFSDHLRQEYEQASIFVFSSRFEGFGMVLSEAQAMGLACISFACKHGPSEIIDDGVNGFLVPPENVDALAEKLLLLMQNDDLRVAFSEKAQKDLYRFDIKTVGDAWENLLESL